MPRLFKFNYCLSPFLPQSPLSLVRSSRRVWLRTVPGFGVDVELLPLTVRQSWEETALPQVVVYLIQTARTALAYLSRHRFGMRFCERTRGVYRRVCVLLGHLLHLGHLCVRTADFAVNTHRRLHLHRVGHVAVDIKRRCGRYVTYCCRQRFYVHAVFQCHGCEGVTQIMEPHVLASRSL